MNLLLVGRCFILAALVEVTHSICPHQEHGLKRWSRARTWPHGKPHAGSSVTINSHVLLDESPPELDHILIEANGRLVWSPSVNITLKLKRLYISGRMDIGSEDCPYTGPAKIILTGRRGEYHGKDHLGMAIGGKVIVVADGGTIEIHGQKKLPWTKLTRTIPKLSKNTGLLFDHQASSNSDKEDWEHAIVAYVISIDSHNHVSVRYYQSFEIMSTWQAQAERTNLIQLLKNISTGDYLLMAVRRSIKYVPADLVGIYEAFETLAFGNVTGNSVLRTLKENDAYTAIVHKRNGLSSLVKEDVTRAVTNGIMIAKSSLVSDNGNVKLTSESFIDSKQGWRDYVSCMAMSKEGGYPKLHLLEDATTWQEGDRVVLTSTDFDWRQAEEATIVHCSDCTSKEIRVDLETKYEHFGEVIDRVDERGEVALLTRNIVIEGEMEARCVSSNGNCHRWNIDTYGGHLKELGVSKAYELQPLAEERAIVDEHINFVIQPPSLLCVVQKAKTNLLPITGATVHVEGAELIHMGQQTDVGRYPLHFHMCFDMRNATNPPYVRENSIHDAFSRCITVHGSHGVTVKDNVCYKTYGHAYFIEDGGEKDTIFDGNIAASVREGYLIPSDKQPACFWITSPLTRMRNNVAAGGMGHGIWYVYPVHPLGPSADKGFLQDNEADHTAIYEFDNNVVHSNVVSGLMADRRLLADGSVGEGQFYEPKVAPLNKSSPAKEVLIYRLTAYKNSYQNAWLRGGWFHLKESSFADSLKALTFARSSSQEQFLSDSVVIGMSKNLGEPAVNWTRSHALSYDPHHPVQGFTFYDGPVWARNIWFDSFISTSLYKAGAIGYELLNDFTSSTVSGIRNAKFGFVDGSTTGNRVYDGDAGIYGFSRRDGDKAATCRDYDGSVTGHHVAHVVKPWPFYTTSQCTYRQNWNMAICPHTYGKIRIGNFAAADTGHTYPIMIREDIPHVNESLTMKVGIADFVVILGGSHTYTLHWTDYVPHEIHIYSDGVEKNKHVRFGVCLPVGATFDLYTYAPYWQPQLSKWHSVTSLADLDNTVNDGKKYFHDKTTGMLYFKFISLYDRAENETHPCPKNRCPMVHIKNIHGNYHDGDCRSRLYHSTRQTDNRHISLRHDTSRLQATSTHPPATWGAGPTKPFKNRIAVDGGFGHWSVWGVCSKSCGGGLQERSRVCDSPMPAHGGKDCQGSHKDTRNCNTQHCALDGGFSIWSHWSACTKVSGCHGYKKRSRSCTNPVPQYDGEYCHGSDEEVDSCVVC